MLNDNRKKAIFLTMVGEMTYEVIRSLCTPLSPRDVSYTEIIEQLDRDFNPIPNEIVQRFNFHKSYQRQDKSIALFVNDLRKLSEHCNYPELDKELRDQIVCGVTDESLQRRLLAEPAFTFQRAFELATAAETAKKNVQDMRTTSKSESTINKIDQEKKSCYRCSEAHDPESCKFVSYTCSFCKKVGHFARNCFKKKNMENKKRNAASKPQTSLGSDKQQQASVSTGQCNTMEEEQSSDGVIYDLNTVTFVKCPDKIIIRLKMNNQPLEMEVDSGASCTIINEEKWMQIRYHNQKLRPTNVKLQTWLLGI